MNIEPTHEVVFLFNLILLIILIIFIWSFNLETAIFAIWDSVVRRRRCYRRFGFIHRGGCIAECVGIDVFQNCANLPIWPTIKTIVWIRRVGRTRSNPKRIGPQNAAGHNDHKNTKMHHRKFFISPDSRNQFGTLFVNCFCNFVFQSLNFVFQNTRLSKSRLPIDLRTLIQFRIK